MINALIYYTGDFKAVLEQTDAEGNRLFNYAFAPVAEMQGVHLLILNEKDDFDDVEAALEATGDDLIVIGVYDENGQQIVWQEQGKASRNHSLAKYKEALNDIVEEGENPRRPTDEEALSTQVNNIFGWQVRDLQDNE